VRIIVRIDQGVGSSAGPVVSAEGVDPQDQKS